MKDNNKKKVLNYKKNNRKKTYKVLIQSAILISLLFMLFYNLLDFKKYNEPDRSQWTNREGFVALSYSSVGRTGSSTVISQKRLEQHLKALYNAGYVTISQQDIMNYYQEGKALPEKALFLSFEDGRNDSVIHGQKLLEKYNYKATLLTYASHLKTPDVKFLQGKDLLKLTKKGFWELGTNGYRLDYINVVEENGQKKYNHYLMDFIRDKEGVPIENKTEMEERIRWDYNQMHQVYEQKLGYMPKVYMIMHANALNNNMNNLVKDVNIECIEKLFSIHFNREGKSFNGVSEDILDLTRLQPKPYWYANHLLMKISADTEQPIDFVVGDIETSKYWEIMAGAAEFNNNLIILTSTPGGSGKAYLKEHNQIKDIKINTKIKGNIIGQHAFYLRNDLQEDTYIKVAIKDNVLIILQKTAKGVVNSLTYPLYDSYVDIVYPLHASQSKNLQISLEGKKLYVIVEGHSVEVDVDPSIIEGSLLLESTYSERNLEDEIYDGVFEGLRILQLDENPLVLFDNSYSTGEKMINKIKNVYDSVIDWAIKTF